RHERRTLFARARVPSCWRCVPMSEFAVPGRGAARIAPRRPLLCSLVPSLAWLLLCRSFVLAAGSGGGSSGGSNVDPFDMVGLHAGDQLGRVVYQAGDIDHDGHTDLIVAAPF